MLVTNILYKPRISHKTDTRMKLIMFVTFCASYSMIHTADSYKYTCYVYQCISFITSSLAQLNNVLVNLIL